MSDELLIIIPENGEDPKEIPVLQGMFPNEHVENVYNFETNPLYKIILGKKGLIFEAGVSDNKRYAMLLPYDFCQWDAFKRTNYLDRHFIRPMVEKHQDKTVILDRITVVKEYDWMDYPNEVKYYAKLYMDLK